MADSYFTQTAGMEVMNGHTDPPQSNKSDIDMLEQIKQLLVENNKLKETMKQKNQEMKERLEELLKREKLREEQGQTEPGSIEVKQRLCELSHENELLRKEIQQLKEKGNLSTQTSTSSAIDDGAEEIKHLKAQLARLQAEKADLLGIISELQVKLSSCATEDSFVEIQIAGMDIGAEINEDKLKDRDLNPDISYRTRCSDDETRAMESEELAVSKLLHSLREETEKVELLQKELTSANERLSQLEKKSDLSDKETETEATEQRSDKEGEEFAERLSLEVENLKEKIEALNKELYETSEKLNEAQVIKNKLQDRCSSLDKKLVDNQFDLDERQTLQYSVSKLELQVESLQSEMKMERSKAEEQQKQLYSLEEALNKQRGDYELLRQAESEKVPKMQFLEVQNKLDSCEKALAKKQLEIDEIKDVAAKHQADSETIDVLRAQIDIYCSDFHAEREARQNIHQEKEQLAARMAFIIQENENLKEERGRLLQIQVGLPLKSLKRNMEGDADLELLTSLLEENEGAEGSSVAYANSLSDPDAYDELFDGDESGSYHESDSSGEGQNIEGAQEDFTTLFGDVDDLEDNTPAPESEKHSPSSSQDRSKKELEDELRKMQEQMKKLQEKLQQTGIAQSPSSVSQGKRPNNQIKASATKQQCSPLKERNVPLLRESSDFAAQLGSSQTSNGKIQAAPKRKLPMSENKSPPLTKSPSFLSQSVESSKPSPVSASQVNSNGTPLIPQVCVEKFSGLRLRKSRVSSSEMERKMGGRKLIRLFQLKNKIATENLEDQDWVTFGVIVKKMTPQSSNNGKTFSIWRLNDLKNLDSCVSLFLFGDVHKEHWKTEQGTVIGILNANPMKPKEGSDDVCLSVDNAQKILLMGEAMDLGTCKARKKNGDSCTQMVNLNDCEYCQYHVQAQYKKVSAKRADLQSSYSGHVPKKMARRGSGLKERLCQDGFHYGGVSSMAYAASIAAASAPKKTVQTTLSNMVVRGADAIALEARKKMAAARKSGVQCSEEFKELLSVPTPGALNLKKHLSGQSVQGSAKSDCLIQSISASELLKQQKQQMLDARRKRTEEIQKKFLESTGKSEASSTITCVGQTTFQSPRQASEFPAAQRSSTPKLARGFAEGEDILFFDSSSFPPLSKLSPSSEAKKLAALRKLKAKGQFLAKADPNSIKRKRSSIADIEQMAQRVETDVSCPEAADENEPAMKRHKEQLAYMQSEEFQKILKAKSNHTGVLKEAEAEIQEKYFDPLVKKEQMEEKMKSIKEQKCRVVTCKTCKYTHYKPLDTCVSENHDFHWHDAVKRFFKCPCGNRTIALDRLPKKPCSTCGHFKWERDGMLKEKSGPKIGGETLLPRGEEHGKFLNSLK
ncbi:protein MCM10 homolog [Phyllobates terribilis]|uniref:protein MCM10 homolog n=1 Tax=Phyllobates terribilis TaxID=111132 RepID=UPI003CCAA62E